MPQHSGPPQNALLDAALTTITATMHGLTPANQKPGLELGPTLTTTVELEGVPVRALLDTGSPATIVSLNLILEVLASQRPRTQSPADWREEVEKRMEPSTVALQNYGGGQLPLIQQIRVKLSKAGNQADAIIQVQHDAPVGLLLGTDVLAPLGFTVLESDSEGVTTDLLRGQNGVVCRIQARKDNPPPFRRERPSSSRPRRTRKSRTRRRSAMKAKSTNACEMVPNSVKHNPVAEEAEERNGRRTFAEVVRAGTPSQKRGKCNNPH